jgi:hypothetical protein
MPADEVTQGDISLGLGCLSFRLGSGNPGGCGGGGLDFF